MNNSKLINIIKTLTKKEFKEFEIFINTSFFNKNLEVKLLLSFLKRDYPEFKNKTYSYGEVANLILGKEDIKKVRYIITDLTKLAEKYITYKAFLEEDHFYLVKALKKRGLNKYFKQESIKKNNKLKKDSQVRDEAYYYQQFELNELSYSFTQEHDNRNIDSELQNLVDNMDLAYLSKKLKYSCEIINRMNILNVDYNIELLNYLLDYIDKPEYQSIPTIKVYSQILKTLKEPILVEHYFQLKESIHKYLYCFREDEQYDLYGYLQNYCIKKINSGDNEFLENLFQTYSEMITTNVVIKNNVIAQFDFKNIVTVALRVEKYEWTENFIAEYQIYLLEEHKANALNYNKARLYFYLKKYREGIRQLLKVEFTDIYYGLDSKALLLKIYYELEDFESAESLMNSFKIYLKRDYTISKDQNLTYSNFLKFTHLIIRYKIGDQKNLNKLENKLNETQQIADLTWLKNKIQELKDK